MKAGGLIGRGGQLGSVQQGGGENGPIVASGRAGLQEESTASPDGRRGMQVATLGGGGERLLFMTALRSVHFSFSKEHGNAVVE